MLPRERVGYRMSHGSDDGRNSTADTGVGAGSDVGPPCDASGMASVTTSARFFAARCRSGMMASALPR